MNKSNSLLYFTLFFTLFMGQTTFAQQLDHVLNEALIQVKPATDTKALEKDLRQIDGIQTEFRTVRKISKQLNIYKVSFNHLAIDEYDMRNYIASHPDVRIVQVNHLLTNRQNVPDDPEIATQWHWINPNNADVDADLAWDITTGGQTANGHNIVVAVFDDGGDLDHPDLIDNNWINEHEIAGNGIDDDNNGYVDDIYGWNFSNNSNNVDGGSHGVEVAGMIGAVGNNANQGTGMNWEVKIMNMRRSGIQEDQVIEFYSYALDQRERYTNSNGTEGSFVVATNSSWGIDGGNPDDAPLWCGFYDTMGEAGILSCGATTNSDDDVDVVGDLPTACSSEFMVAVTATDINDNRTFSGYGATTIDVAAPGEDVYTTTAGGGYGTDSGTSYASPLTAGIIALLYSAPCGNLANLAMADPQLAAEQVRDALFEGAELVGNLEGDVVYGRVNAFNSLEIIMGNCGPCPTPVGIQASAILDVSVSLNWVNPSDGLSADLRYRVLGTPDWTDISGATMPLALSGLTACTAYEVQVAAFCVDNLESGYSASATFTTEGCCVAPDELAISNIVNTSALAEWNSIFAAQSYNLRWRETGTADWVEMNLNTNSFNFTTLTPCTVYETQVQTVCTNATTEFSDLVSFSTFGCGACTDLTYCESVGEDISDEWIASFILADINNQTPDAPPIGYTDFTGTVHTTNLLINTTYNTSMTPGHSSTTFPEYFKIYIDYNQDGEFDETSELAFDADSTSNTTVSGEVSIPSDALSGLTRLRVIMKWNGEPTACESPEYGETEDYCVTILEGVPPPSCAIPMDLDTAEITTTSVEISWSAADNATAYGVRYRSLTTVDWTILDNISNTNITLTNLNFCTDYEYQVRTFCPTAASEWSGSMSFTTGCIDVAVNEVENGVAQLSFFPNPFSESISSYFDLLETMDLKLEVFAATGQRLISKEYRLGAGVQKLPVLGLDNASPGVYFISITTDKGMKIRRVVKQ